MDDYVTDVWVRKLKSRFSKLGLRSYNDDSDYQIQTNHLQSTDKWSSRDDETMNSPLEKSISNDSFQEIVANSENSSASISNTDHQQIINDDNGCLDVVQLCEKRLSYFDMKSGNNKLSSDCTEIVKTANQMSCKSVCNEQQNAGLEERAEVPEFYTRPNSAGEVSKWGKYNWQTSIVTSDDDDDHINRRQRRLSNENIDLMLDWWGLRNVAVDSELSRYLPRNTQNIISAIKINSHHEYDQSDTKLSTREYYRNDNMDGIFPVGFDETELALNRCQGGQYSSDSDSDFTHDDPIMKRPKAFKLSPRILISPKGFVFEQTVTPSPPKPQIPGLLYHEFAGQDINNTGSLERTPEHSNVTELSSINDKIQRQMKIEIPDYPVENQFNDKDDSTLTEFVRKGNKEGTCLKFNNSTSTMGHTAMKKSRGCNIGSVSNWCIECQRVPERTAKTKNETEKLPKDDHRSNSTGKNQKLHESSMAWNIYNSDNCSSKPFSSKKNISRAQSSSYKGNIKHENYSRDCAGSWPKTSKINKMRNKPRNWKKKNVVNKTKLEKEDLAIDLTSLKIGNDDDDKTTTIEYGKYDEATSYILYLPDEIIVRIVGQLSNFDLARCSQVCKQLYRICQDEALWKTIILKKQNISDETLVNIGSKKPVHLALIHCHGDSVTSTGLRELFRKCGDNLQELNFSCCSGGQLIGESILLHVALRCKKLKSVDASWSNVGDNGIEALVQNVDRLECICLNGCQAITNRSLKVIADKHGESLRTFETFGCFNVSAGAIKQLGMKCPNLQTLSLGQCYKITSPAIGHVVSHLKSIVNLDLRGCKQAKDACVETIAKHCPLLVNLVLANCQMISDVAMTEIANNLPSVRFLDVCGCFKVTDHGVKALAQSCNRLNYLDLSSTSITQKSVILLANYCSQNLKSLKLSFCVNVTNDSVTKLVKHCKKMTTLHLYGCKKLKNIEALQKFNTFLKLEF